MATRIARRGTRCFWLWVVVILLAQGCGGGGGGGQSTGPTTTISLRLTGLDTALLPTNCATASLTVTGPGMNPITATIPGDGILSLPIPAGPARVFTVTLVCAKSGGARTFTGQQVSDVAGGQAITLTIHVAVNEPPVVAPSCSPSSVPAGISSSCTCGASDPDPGDRLTFSWSATGGSLSSPGSSSTQFQSGSPGTFTLTCEVSDGKATRTGSTTVTVGATTTTLSVGLAGTGSGSVTSSPPGIACPTTCSASFGTGTPVTLTATAASGSTFAGWTGACGGTGACTVTVAPGVAVTAIFNTAAPPPLVTLTLNKLGPGSGTVTSAPPGINCGPVCVTFSATFPSGTPVTLTASGANFGGWGGACAASGTSPTCTLTLTVNTTVTATFN